MDYEKKYKEALERAREYHKVDYDNTMKLYAKGTMEYLFPELKESEGEKIRKWLIGYFNQYIIDGMPQVFGNGLNVKDVLAWLEKQGEQKPTTDIQNLTWEDIEKIGEIINIVQYENPNGIGAKCLYTDVLERFLDEKQTKQKVINDTDEEIVEAVKDTSVLDLVEPKFKVGDWVVYCNEDVDLITGIEENGYCINNGGYIPFICASDIRLWTIQDAKDGDVLAIEPIDVDYPYPFVAIYKERGLDYFNSYCNVGFNGIFYINGSGHYINVHPATKEQRDLLFQKMKEASYEWDADKKELKEIELKPAWSEEDEYVYNEILKRVADKKLYEHDLEYIYKWLKSLKPQPQWKPSEEELNALDEVYKTHGANSACRRVILRLLNDLKKL